MAFPENSVLDDFNRSDGDLGSNWTQPSFGATDFQIFTNAVRPDSPSTLGADYWNPSTFGPDVECYATLSTCLQYFSVHARWLNVGSSSDGYYVQARDPDSEIRIYRIDDDSATQLGSSISQTTDSGDKLGIECVDDQITAYFNDGGAGWSSVGSRTDSTYDAVGYVGISAYTSSGAQRMDDVGGGTLGEAEEEAHLLALLGVGE